jgi:hypothetical protein
MQREESIKTEIPFKQFFYGNWYIFYAPIVFIIPSYSLEFHTKFVKKIKSKNQICKYQLHKIGMDLCTNFTNSVSIKICTRNVSKDTDERDWVMKGKRESILDR